MVLLHLIDVSFAFGFSGNDVTRNQLVTASNVFACTRVCVCVCVCVRAHTLQNEMLFKRNDRKIILNVSAYIRRVRLRNIAGDLAGARVRVSGWGKTSDS
jgi:hypothetical protein